MQQQDQEQAQVQECRRRLLAVLRLPLARVVHQVVVQSWLHSHVASRGRKSVLLDRETQLTLWL